MSPPGHRPVPVPDRSVWVNGRILRGPDAVLSAFDRGARDGEGLFETIRIERTAPQLWRLHLERLVLSCAELGFPVPPSPAILRAALDETLAANQLEDAAARITVTRGVPGGRPTRTGCWIEVEPLTARLWMKGAKPGVGAVFSKVPFAPGAINRHKTTSRIAYQLAREEARAAGVEEALLAGADGEVLEGAVTNVFAVIAGEVLTPPLASNILPGVMRRAVLARCRELGMAWREARIGRPELLGAEEVFLTNAIQRVVPVDRVGGRAWRAWPVTGRLLDAWDFAPLADNPTDSPLTP